MTSSRVALYARVSTTDKDLNSSNIDNPNTVFVWEIIRCKIKAKAKEKAGAKQ